MPSFVPMEMQACVEPVYLFPGLFYRAFTRFFLAFFRSPAFLLSHHALTMLASFCHLNAFITWPTQSWQYQKSKINEPGELEKV